MASQAAAVPLRRIAREHFDSDRLLTRMLAEAGVA